MGTWIDFGNRLARDDGGLTSIELSGIGAVVALGLMAGVATAGSVAGVTDNLVDFLGALAKGSAKAG